MLFFSFGNRAFNKEYSFDDILNIQRIKCDSSDPYRDEYLVETQDEYIMFLWSVTA